MQRKPDRTKKREHSQYMSKEQKLEPGDRAPDGLALDADGREVSLQSYWAGGPVLLTFLRHFG
jgi:hypothetical protein